MVVPSCGIETTFFDIVKRLCQTFLTLSNNICVSNAHTYGFHTDPLFHLKPLGTCSLPSGISHFLRCPELHPTIYQVVSNASKFDYYLTKYYFTTWKYYRQRTDPTWVAVPPTPRNASKSVPIGKNNLSPIPLPPLSYYLVQHYEVFLNAEQCRI